MSIIISADNINITKGNSTLFHNMNFMINRGQYVLIKGHNCSGKSTILNIIGLKELPDSGSLRIFKYRNLSIDGSKTREIRKKRISYVPIQSLNQNLTLSKSLLKVLKYTNIAKTEKLILIKDKLHKMGLENYEHVKISQMSKSNQKKAEVLLTLIKPAEILILDEPFAYLDHQNIQLLISILENLKRQEDKTLLMTCSLDYTIPFIDKYIYL